MNRLAVVGHPVAHSLSPAMHTAAFAALGLGDEWSYEAIDLEPERFAAGSGAAPSAGSPASTSPSRTNERRSSSPIVRSDAVAAIGAANTLTFAGGSIRADNTDASGLIAALPARLRPRPAPRRSCSAPAARPAPSPGRSTAPARRVTIANRTESKAVDLARELGDLRARGRRAGRADRPRALRPARQLHLRRPCKGGCGAALRPGCDLKALRLRADQLVAPLVVVDLVYGSEPTELAATCTSGGATLIDGLEILVRQGADSFRIWVGREPPIETMRDTIRANR